MRIQLNHLATFEAVLKTGSFASAGRLIGYTAPAVAQHIKALEDAMGFVLFRRGAKGVIATSNALSLRDEIAPLLAMLDNVNANISAISAGLVGQISIGSTPTLTSRLLPPVIRDISQRSPRSRLSLLETSHSELLNLINEGRIDLALAYDYDVVPRVWPSGIKSVRIITDAMVLVTPSSMHDRIESINHDLAGSPWIACAPGTITETLLLRLCARAGFEPRILYRSNYYPTITSLVAAQLGCSVIPETELRHSDHAADALAVSPAIAHRRAFALYRDDNGPLVSHALSVLTREFSARPHG